MKNTSSRVERGQVGIGTLVVFISMVLVAALAAGVLVETAGYLQGKSEQTGVESTQGVSNRLQVIQQTGEIDAWTGDTYKIDLNVRRAPGAGDVNVSAASVLWIGPDEALDVPPGAKGRSLTAISGSTPVLTSDEDVFTLSLIYWYKPYAGQLDGDESAVVRITTESGGTTTVTLTAPEQIWDESAVQL